MIHPLNQMGRCTCTLCYPQEISAAARNAFSSKQLVICSAVLLSQILCLMRRMPKSTCNLTERSGAKGATGVGWCNAGKGPKVASFGMLGSLTTSPFARHQGRTHFKDRIQSHPWHLCFGLHAVLLAPKLYI